MNDEIESDGHLRGLGPTIGRTSDRHRVPRDALEQLTGSGHFVYTLRDRQLRCSQNLLFLMGLPMLPPPSDLYDLLSPVHPSGMTDFRTALECAVQSEVPFDLTAQVLGADRPARILQFRGDVTSTLSGERALVGVATDVTTVAVSNAELSSSVKLALMGRIADGIAHDFNDAISAIKCFAAFALDGALGNDAVQADIREVVTAADKATALTEQLLAAVQSGVSSSQLIDINEHLQTLKPVFDRMGGREAGIALDIDEGLLPVFTDPSTLEQVIVTAASHAIEAVASGRTLHIRGAMTMLSPAQAASHPRLGGPGMYICVTLAEGDAPEGAVTSPPRNHATRNVEPPLAAPSWMTACQGLLDTARGEIRGIRREGQDEIEVWLPAVDRPFDIAAVPPMAAEIVPEDTSILVVEDEGHVRRAVVRILRRAGYHVVDAADGRTALSWLENGEVRPDLLITDVVMPHMSGWELATRAEERLPDLRVLVMTGYGKGVRGQGIETGQARLEKPFTPKALLAKVTEIFEERPVAQKPRP